MRSPRALFLFTAFFLLTGMAGAGRMSNAQLKPEIRLKIYNEAIHHYEKAKALYREARAQEALGELQKAIHVIRAFPEAYDLARKIYLDLGNEREAEHQSALFKTYEGGKGASLFRLRDEVARVVRLRIKSAPPPDFEVKPAFFHSGLLAGILFLGMTYDWYRMKRKMKRSGDAPSLILGSFPGDEEKEARISWFFKLCLLLLPAPSIFSLLLFVGVRYYSDLVPVFLFYWVLADLAIYLIFFADFSGLGGAMRRPGG